MVRRRFLLTILTFLVIGGATALAIFLAKGYRVSTKEKTFFGTGIMSITSMPEQASVYLDGGLVTATNANINSLEPKSYTVKIVKEGYIPWEKKVDVREGLVTEIKATLFPAIPSVYPLTYNGVQNSLLSPDGRKLAFIIPINPQASVTEARKSGVWVWDMSDRTVAFARGQEPHQVFASSVNGTDLTKASMRWSPDSVQLLVSNTTSNWLLEAGKINDNPKDITAILKPTLASWDEEVRTNNNASLAVLKDENLKKTASTAAVLKWSADETKLLYSLDGKSKFKVYDLKENKSYDLPESASYNWVADSRHLVLTQTSAKPTATPTKAPIATTSALPLDQSGGVSTPLNLILGEIALIEFDGNNKSVVYAGSFDPQSVFSWPDGSRIGMVSFVPTPTASQPNLFGINLK